MGALFGLAPAGSMGQHMGSIHLRCMSLIALQCSLEVHKVASRISGMPCSARPAGCQPAQSERLAGAVGGRHAGPPGL